MLHSLIGQERRLIDLSSPRLEQPKHMEFRWLAASDLGALDENRGKDDHMIRDVVRLALRSEPRQ